MTKLGTRVDELEINRLKMLTRGVSHQTLAKNERTLLDTDDGTLEHDPILIDLTIVDKTTHGSNALLGKISGRLATRIVSLLTNLVHFFVHLGTMKVSILTGTGDSGGHTGRMPRSNAGNLTETAVSLTGKARDAPTSSDALESVTLGDAHDVDLFVFGKDGINRHFLLKEGLGKVNLGLGIRTAIDLNLHNVSLFETKVEFLDLRVSNHTNDGAKLGNAVELVLNVLSSVFLVLESVLGEGLLLGLVPVLVAATLELFAQMLCKDGSKSTKTIGSLHVSNDTDNHHRRSLEDGDSVHDFTLVHESTGTVHTADHVGHARLVAAKGSQVRRVGIGITGEGTDATRMVFRTLLGQEPKTSMARSFKLAMRPVMAGGEREKVSKR